MKIVKLNAINSTNTFLKDLARESIVENYTVVVAENQTDGKGQFDNKWVSEKGKNLTFSMICKFDNLKVDNAFYLNCAISLAIYTVLKEYIPNRLTVKWPNDILSFQKKLCGILIENVVSTDKIQQAIVGVGLNVNQEIFPISLPNATSLKLSGGNDFDKEMLLKKLIEQIIVQVELIIDKQFKLLKQRYESILYKKGEPAIFKNVHNENFMGKILGITEQGNLVVELDNDCIETYDLKEIQFM